MIAVSLTASSQDTSKSTSTLYENKSNIMRTILNKYYELLQRAEETTSRREAVSLIRESTKLREQIHNGHALRGT